MKIVNLREVSLLSVGLLILFVSSTQECSGLYDTTVDLMFKLHASKTLSIYLMMNDDEMMMAVVIKGL